MYRSMLLGCVAVFTWAALNQGIAQDRPAQPPQKTEYRAVLFGTDPEEATKVLNELNAAGWEYVGPLANGLVAYRRYVLSEADIAAKKEYDRLQGAWVTVSAERDGVRQNDERREKVTFSGTRFTIQLDDEVTQEGVYRVGSIGPKFVQLDLLVTDGYGQGDTWIGVFQIEGDRMKWCGCYLSESRVRPKSLTTRDDDGNYARTLKRDKEK